MKNLTLNLLVILGLAATPSLVQGQQGQAAEQGQRGQGQGQGRGQGSQGGQGAQGRGGQRAPAAPARPTPRWPDGHVNLGPPSGEKGIWSPAGINAVYQYPNPVNRVGAATLLPNPTKFEDVPFQEWAKDLHEARERNFESDEPHTRCKASPGPRQFITPYGTEIVEFPDLQRIYIFDIGGPHTYRTIFMDGRQHPKDLKPSYYGHSIGHWEGDTLVVDTIGYNERAWIDREGTPTTTKLHMTERFTRPDMNTLRYEITVDDPGAYTKPWNGGFQLRWNAGTELFEYICQDNNIAATEMLGAGTVTRSSQIVP